MSAANISQKYIQEKNLPLMFDVSKDFFKERKGIAFFEKVHYFVPPTTSRTKKVILWDVKAVENWLRGEKICKKIDPEIDNLLKRR